MAQLHRRQHNLSSDPIHLVMGDVGISPVSPTHLPGLTTMVGSRATLASTSCLREASARSSSAMAFCATGREGEGGGGGW